MSEIGKTLDPEAGFLGSLEAAVLSMDTKSREIFLAKRLEGLSYHEIARKTGLTVEIVESRMAVAIAHIDRCLTLPERPRGRLNLLRRFIRNNYGGKAT